MRTFQELLWWRGHSLYAVDVHLHLLGPTEYRKKLIELWEWVEPKKLILAKTSIRFDSSFLIE